MKVIYVLPDKLQGKKDKELTQAFKSIVIGHTYTVVFEDDQTYELEEFPAKRKDEQILWDKNCFVPLDDNTEDEQMSELCDKLEKLADKLTQLVNNN